MSDDRPDLGDADALLESARREQMAFRMFLAGYEQRVDDEVKRPSSLRDADRFRDHIKSRFEQVYDDE